MKKRNKRRATPKKIHNAKAEQVFFPGYGGVGGFGGCGVGLGVTPFGPTFGIGAGVGFPIGGFGYYGGWL